MTEIFESKNRGPKTLMISSRWLDLKRWLRLANARAFTDNAHGSILQSRLRYFLSLANVGDRHDATF
ncbi:MAG: hypothetical protein LLF97_01235 [Planctomycetaceae bacterium]|nr:hypothetical protein [Planctomycetaceae bacterium]